VIEARDPGSAQTAQQGGGQDFWPEEKPGRKRPRAKLLIGAAAALAVVVVATVAAVLLTGGGDEAPAKPAVPVAYTPDYLGEGFAPNATRSAATRAITEGEAFAANNLKSGK
jgi:hypothetical protein